jgi:aryl-alcohol dehydrogenase-like predicted oxidoreductase
MAVEYRRLGKHGTLVSNLCLGTVNFGTWASEKDSFAIMDRALEHGINFFDTADVYGYEFGYGLVEETIGRWLAQGDGRRDAIVLASKVYSAFLQEGLRPEPNRQSKAIGAVKIRRQLESSLRRLQTDVIDLYQMHHIDRECPWEETWQAFDTLVKQGKIHYVGSSNFAGWDIATACQEASRRHMMGLVSEQTRYSLACRTPELEVIPACRHYGMGLLPWGPVYGGILGGILKKLPKGGRRAQKKDSDIKEFLAKHRKQIERYEALCKKLGEEPAVVAQAWLLHNPAVTSIIIGPRTLKHLESSIRATEITLDDETLQKLDEIWPGPGGEAPEAYAW